MCTTSNTPVSNAWNALQSIQQGRGNSFFYLFYRQFLLGGLCLRKKKRWIANAL